MGKYRLEIAIGFLTCMEDVQYVGVIGLPYSDVLGPMYLVQSAQIMVSGRPEILNVMFYI